MGRIRLLSEEVARKIAAGEVVERPASVVKELVENSLDAQARRIDICLEKGGKALIRVSDDGEGIEPEDLPLAVERHATSKVSSDEDLERVRTLGFRGEALAAIGSVSRLTIVSRPRGFSLGGRIEVRFGQKGPLLEAGAPEGTTVEVADIFANLPARRRFLKSDRAETAHVLETIRALALAHEEVGFRVESGGRKLLALNKEPLVRRLARLVGLAEKDFLDFEAQQGPFQIWGYLSRPEKARRDLRAFYFFVLMRPVKAALLSRALMEATKGFFMAGLYPAGALFIDLPPELVDVNVHPAKLEVRFRKEREVFGLIHQAIRHRLLKIDPDHHPKGGLSPPETQEADIPLEAPKTSSSRLAKPLVAEGLFDYQTPPKPHPLGQILATYILCEDEKGLLIFDQHALHERILYERLRQGLKTEGLPAEPLLFPIIFEAPARLIEALEEGRDFLARLGIEARAYGPAEIAISAWPRGFLRETLSQTTVEILERLSQDGLPEEDSLLHEILSLLACRSAIKAGDRLSLAEMEELLRQSEQYPSDYCPHGRPTMARLGKEDLERLFRRK
ncbi:DNA mismatch repair endonuclease MutL [Thermosulfuriphilus sp.]